MNLGTIGAGFEILLSLVTAMATAATALIMWRQMHGGVVVEQETDYLWAEKRPDGFRIRFEFRNNTGSSIRLHRVRVKGLPLVSVFAGDRDEKHERWALNETPPGLHEVEPTRSGAFSVRVKPDWSAWRSQKRSKEYALWTIIIEYASKDAPTRTRRHAAKIRTHVRMIEQASSPSDTSSIAVS